MSEHSEAYLLVFFLFGLFVGIILTYAKYKYAYLFAKRLKDDHDYIVRFTNEQLSSLLFNFMLFLSISTVLLYFIYCIYSYNIKSLESMNDINKQMLANGYEYVPSRLAGWDKRGKEIVQRVQLNNNKDFSPNEQPVISE